jgi:hypothetical protein
MGPLNFFKQFVSTSFEKLHGAKKSSLNNLQTHEQTRPEQVDQNKKIHSLSDRIHHLKTELEPHRTRAWESLSKKLPLGLAQKFSRILVNTEMIQKFTPDELQKVSPHFWKELTPEQMNALTSKQFLALLPKNVDQVESLKNLEILLPKLTQLTIEQLKKVSPDLLAKLTSHVADKIKQVKPEEVGNFIQNPANMRAILFLDKVIQTGRKPYKDAKKALNILIEKNWQGKVVDYIIKSEGSDKQKSDMKSVSERSPPTGKKHEEGVITIFTDFQRDIPRCSSFIVNGKDVIANSEKESRLGIAIESLAQAFPGEQKEMVEAFEKILHQGAFNVFYAPLREKYSLIIDPEGKQGGPLQLSEIAEKSITYEIDTKKDPDSVTIKYRIVYRVKNAVTGKEEPVELSSGAQIKISKEVLKNGDFSNAEVTLEERLQRLSE